MQFTNLKLDEEMKRLVKEQGPAIVEMLEKDKKKGITNSDTDKARNKLFLDIKAVIDKEGPIFKNETLEAVRVISELTASCSKTLKEVDETVKKLQVTYDPAVAKQTMEKLKPLANAPGVAADIKKGMVNHLEWRGSLPPVNGSLSANMVERLNTAFTTWRDAPLKAFMDVKDKVAKTEEYKTRAEHFATLMKGLDGEGAKAAEVIRVLYKDHKMVEEYVGKISNVASSGYSDSSDGPKELKELLKKKGDPKGLVSRVTGLQSKLKVARSQVNTIKLIRDGFLKKAGALAGTSATKKMAEEIKSSVGNMEKAVGKFESAFNTYRTEFNKVSPVKV